jgi:hypothetical protein
MTLADCFDLVAYEASVMVDDDFPTLQRRPLIARAPGRRYTVTHKDTPATAPAVEITFSHEELSKRFDGTERTAAQSQRLRALLRHKLNAVVKDGAHR